jgi:F1F0 ATPase subunit 2
MTTLAPALAAGVLLGAIFYGGLWWTIQKGVVSDRPALWFFGSGLLRMGFVLAGFYVVARSGWRPSVVCLLGFGLARLVVTRLIREATPPIRLSREAGDAS